MGKLSTKLFGLSGRIDNLVFRRYNNTTVVYPYPDYKKREPTVRQKPCRDRFKNAANYATLAMKDENLKREYRLKALEYGKGNAYNAATRDFLHKPHIRDVAFAGSATRIIAVDDFKVTRVDVRLQSQDGTIVDEGQAFEIDTNLWYYSIEAAKTGALLELIITAWDLPGNSDTKRTTVAY